jgi:hypothetical protein
VATGVAVTQSEWESPAPTVSPTSGRPGSLGLPAGSSWLANPGRVGCSGGRLVELPQLTSYADEPTLAGMETLPAAEPLRVQGELDEKVA